MMGIAVLGGVVGPVIAGRVFDTTGTYSTILIIYAVLTAVAIPAILLARRPSITTKVNIGLEAG